MLFNKAHLKGDSEEAQVLPLIVPNNMRGWPCLGRRFQLRLPTCDRRGLRQEIPVELEGDRPALVALACE